jgi:Zn-finger nucleic acid-binding protein
MRFDQIASAKCDKCGVVYGDRVLTKLIEVPRIITIENKASLYDVQRAVASIAVVCPHCFVNSRRTVVRDISFDDLEQLLYRGDIV